MPDPVVAHFQTALEACLKELEVVTVFSRLNALLPQRALLQGAGECRTLKKTVSIDLTLPLEVQHAGYRRNHKNGVHKLRRDGLTCTQDFERKYLDEFVNIYHETMQRVDARPEFYFPASYFKRLLANFEERTRLFVCLQEGRVVCGGLFLESCGILQHHLGGTRNDSLKAAPMKLLIDDVRLWATQQKYRRLHLGGGVASNPQDLLLHFKLGFSDQVHDFAVWNWIVMPYAYRRLCAEKALWNHGHGLQAANTEFFPEYRSPTIPDAAAFAPLTSGEAERSPPVKIVVPAVKRKAVHLRKGLAARHGHRSADRRAERTQLTHRLTLAEGAQDAGVSPMTLSGSLRLPPKP
jgi:hypothetical protein